MLFQKLATENADADPDDGRRAPFVAKALTALADYLKRGVKGIGVRPNPERAVELPAACGDRLRRQGRAVRAGQGLPGRPQRRDDVKRGMHYLSVLTEEGYPGAQAFLADLYWRGRHVKKDEQRALALITVAVENAPEHERIWIEDIYQNIFCGTSQGTRKQADGIVATWQQDVRPSRRAVRPHGARRRSSRSASAATARWSTSAATEPAAKDAAGSWRRRQRRGPSRCRAAPASACAMSAMTKQ